MNRIYDFFIVTQPYWMDFIYGVFFINLQISIELKLQRVV